MNLAQQVVAPEATCRNALAVVLLSGSLLTACATPQKPPQFAYDAYVPSLPAAPAPAKERPPKPLHIPPGWTPAQGGAAGNSPTARVENANAAARVEPRREGYYNAIQIYPWSEGALYQVYGAPGRVTDIALEPGENLTGTGPIAAGDTARWIIGDTESGAGLTRRVHVLAKPTRADITTNLVITTDRRSYMIELRADQKLYMPAVAWAYPAPPGGQEQAVPAAPMIPGVQARNYRYGLTGDAPPWKPVMVYDDGRHVYVEFPHGIVQGEMPPIFVIGPDGEPQIVNTRVYRNILIVDRLFGAAELRLGSGKRQQTVRIVRTDGPETGQLSWIPRFGAVPKVTSATAQSGGGAS
ncbi:MULTISPECIES: P-type conjugative transfer protein TrbG [unclassified Mesorhizobium]|uniref:P-type conjugative transfer protein TrbG n=1 Tax=unclassified Mesorhizobium TaxID=325217 RepID=UPI000FCC2DD9|nr:MULTISPECIES: P-type conjugative transfer protein TrbG [unclassified Mesorhizobium]RUV26107.1 P-type conjugative transfer protein TrbG [Mesorhizobium sp. M1A.F.Ca.IN.022.04.1.1]RWG31480.1 MAG: P-type conjugative transfer protein TrbG [Mesorhizobium sp.]